VNFVVREEASLQLLARLEQVEDSVQLSMLDLQEHKLVEIGQALQNKNGSRHLRLLLMLLFE